MIELAQTRNEYDPHINLYSICSLAFLSYAYSETFILSSETTLSLSMKEPRIFLGLIVGAMLPYLLIFNMVCETKKVAPVFSYDLALQID